MSISGDHAQTQQRILYLSDGVAALDRASAAVGARNDRVGGRKEGSNGYDSERNGARKHHTGRWGKLVYWIVERVKDDGCST